MPSVKDILLLLLVLPATSASIACTVSGPLVLSPSELAVILEKVDAKFSEIDSRTPLFSYGANGSVGSLKIHLEFESSQADFDGSYKVLEVECAGSSSDLACEPVSEKRSVHFPSSHDHVDLIGEIGVDEAMDVLQYLQGALPRKNDSQPTHRGLVREDIGRIRTISRNYPNDYSLTAMGDACFDVNIDVRREPCATGKCEFKIIRNCDVCPNT